MCTSQKTWRLTSKQGLPGSAQASAVKTVGVDGVKSLVRIHPIACLNYPQRGMPPDLTLESDDCLTLWQTMVKLQTAAYTVPQQLHPAQFFGLKIPVKADILNWGAALKVLLAQWMVEREKSPFFDVVKALSGGVEAESIKSKSTQTLETKVKDMNISPAEIENVDKTSKRLLRTTLPLLCDLRANNALPAILFHYDRAGCEDLAVHLLDQLTEAEDKFKKKDPEWRENMELYEAWVKMAPVREKQARAQEKKTSKKSKGKDKDSMRDDLGGKDNRAHHISSSKDMWFESFNPEAPL
jgi:ATP-dependent RNA helicase DDX60